MNILLVRGKPTFMDMIVGIPIGLVYIAPIAQRKGHHTEVLDLALDPEWEAILDAKLAERQWHLAGFSSMTAEYEGAEAAARRIKQFDPSIQTIFGGQHPTILPDEVLANDYCDFVCVGEGEETFSEFLDVLERNGSFSGVTGLAFKETGEGRTNLPRQPIWDVDEIPLPAYELLDLERYATAESARYTPRYQRAIQVFTSRGCPWHCTYCHDLFGKKFRARSPEHVVKEMKMLYYDYNIQEFMIEDDIFNFDMDRAKRICDLIVDEGMEIALQFGNGIRLERIDEELVEKLAAAGTHHVSIAIESASPRIQQLSKKYLKLHMVNDVARWMRKYKINTLGFFMIGFPTETVSEIKMTIRFACQTELEEALFSIVIPYAGTELSRQIMEKGWYDPDRKTDHLHEVAKIKTSEFDFATLKRLQKWAYIKFFLTRFRFVRLAPKLFSIRSSRRYLKAIERNFLPEALTGETSRVN